MGQGIRRQDRPQAQTQAPDGLPQAEVGLLRPCPTCGGTGTVVAGLTHRQLQVVTMYARTGDQRRTAEALDMGLQTVKNHLTTAYRKLGVNSFIETAYMLWLHEHFGD